MLDLIKKQEYKNRLYKAFPHKLKNDVTVVLSILPLDDKTKLADGSDCWVDDLIRQSNPSMTILLGGGVLVIPYRIYFNEPDTAKEAKLTDRQKIILHCIYLRHHNGYVRQNRLERLIESDELWIIPFTFQLLGEYIYEILEVLDKHINDKTIDMYRQFVSENEKYSQLTRERVISYWDVYYRGRSPILANYLGQHLIDRILAK